MCKSEVVFVHVGRAGVVGSGAFGLRVELLCSILLGGH
jgi:hypothetical protein